MTFETIRNIFAWCSVINYGLLLIWSLPYLLARNWTFGIYSKVFKLSSTDTFNVIMCGGFTIYSLLILVFNIVPYFAMRIVG